MQVEILTLCKNATLENGFLTIFESFHIITLPYVPIKITNEFCIIADITFDKDETPKIAKLVIINPNNEIIKEVIYELLKPTKLYFSRFQTPVKFNLAETTIETFGDYLIKLYIDGIEAKEIMLHCPDTSLLN